MQTANRLMKILLIHNYYQQRGGEDFVFEAETNLLQQNGQTIETLVFSNNSIKTDLDKLKTGFLNIYNPFSIRQLRQKIEDFQPDLVHVHNFFPIASPAILKVAKSYGLPVVMTLHNFRLICPNALLYRDRKNCEACIAKLIPIDGILHGCYRGSRFQSASIATMNVIHNIVGTWRNSVDRYITLNPFSRERILSSALGLQPEQITVKPNFTFDPLILNQHINQNPTREDYFIFIGRLSHEKGIDILLEAFRQTSHQLKVVGTGPLEALVQAARSDRIEVLGFQNHAEILKLLRKARALVLPSTCYENFPMTILEAFSSGTPVITSHIGGLPSIVENNFNGLLAEPGSASDLAKQIERMARETRYEVFCSNARETYLAKYTPEINYQLLMDIYTDASNASLVQEKKCSKR